MQFIGMRVDGIPSLFSTASLSILRHMRHSKKDHPITPAAPHVAYLRVRCEPELKEALRIRAAQHGRSMDAEIRQILKDTLGQSEDHHELNVAEAISQLFEPIGGVDLEPHPPVPVPEPPKFDR
jgi:plasmid stability protein